MCTIKSHNIQQSGYFQTLISTIVYYRAISNTIGHDQKLSGIIKNY